jgi:uncharacterized membrane protein (UPF0127 family)
MFQTIAAAAVITLLSLLSLASCSKTSATGLAVETITLAGQAYELEVAVTESQIRRGMGGRTEVPPRTGMIFIFPDLAMRNFWMKDCLVALDIVFMDGRGWITAVHTMPAPEPGTPDSKLPLFSSRRPAQFAIELAEGEAGRLGLKPDMRVDLPLDRLKAYLR